MAIKNISFTGETPPHLLPNPIAALKELNDWRSRNSHLRLICIETRQRVPLQPEAGDRFVEPMFDMFLVWYED